MICESLEVSYCVKLKLNKDYNLIYSLIWYL